MRILLVEDEDQIRNLIKLNLTLEGDEVVACPDGFAALDSLANGHFDIAVLDLMLPNMDGMQICEHIKLKFPDMKVIIVSAKDRAEDRIKGLKAGADDYLIKPFALEELLLRITNLKKQLTPEQSSDISSFKFDEFEIYFNEFFIQGPNGKIEMTPKECALLKLLVDKKNQVVTKTQILQFVWGYDVYPSTRTIDNFILAFRKYFEINPKEPKYFHTVRGVGYRFTP